jgi:hypothetical protein
MINKETHMKKIGFEGFFQGLILDSLVCSWLFPFDPSLEAASHLQATCLVLGATPEAIS